MILLFCNCCRIVEKYYYNIYSVCVVFEISFNIELLQDFLKLQLLSSYIVFCIVVYRNLVLYICIVYSQQSSHIVVDH